MAHTRVKICGITTAADARAAALAGADAIGLNFWPHTARAVDVARAVEVSDALPPFVSRVGVFVDPEPALVESVLAAVRLDLLQFHGAESEQECARYGLPYMKVVAVREGVDLREFAARYQGAQALLLDAYHAAMPGGSGATFDWGLIPSALDLPLVLAGGLNAGNVGNAIRTVRPYAVDVSGGVELSRGVKDAAKMAAFVREVRRGEAD